MVDAIDCGIQSERRKYPRPARPRAPRQYPLPMDSERQPTLRATVDRRTDG